MKTVIVYMGPMCSYCDAAKRLLTRNNIVYKEINIALEEGKMDEMLKNLTVEELFHKYFLMITMLVAMKN